MDMEGHETSDAKVHCPKKAFLSRARSSSTSISGSSSASLKDLTGLDILASSSELLATKRPKDDSLTFISLPDDVKASFSKRSRDDSLSYASLPDEMKISFSELEETGLKLEDLNFAIPESIEDAAPSNVTLDLTPRPEVSSHDVEPNVPPFNNTISSTSSVNEYEIPNNRMQNAQTNNSNFVNSSQSVCDSSGMNSNATYGPMAYSEMEIPNNSVSSNNVTCTSHLSGTSSDSNKTKTTDYSRSQSAGTDIGSLLKESSNALTGVSGYQGWETVTELPWEEISQVSTTVGSSTEDAPKKKRRMSGMSKNKKMDNIMCQVCADQAAGFYCGAYICEACKKFYMRAYKQERLKYVCLRDKQCPITKESRVQCQYCRYQKCLSLNMYCPKQVSEGDPPKETQKMSDIPCRVCSAPSSGFHFGAITCEGCKGFFRRMAKERELQRYQCTKDGNCEINMMTRNLCKACRYSMCLKVGMSVEASRIGRQPNSVKHEISLELKHGVKPEPGARARHKSDHDPVKIKKEPQEFHQECSMSKTQKSLSWEGWGTDNFQPVLEHSVSIPGLSAESDPEQGPSKERSGPIWDILFEKLSQNTSQGMEDLHDKGSQKAANLEVPLTQIVPNKVPSSTVTSQNIHVMPGNYDSKKSLQGEVTLQKDISKKSFPREDTIQKCLSEGHTRHSLERIPEADQSQVDSDTSSTSDEEQTAQHKEMMTLINEVIEAGRVLEIVNYRVFDTDFIHNGKFMVEDVKVNFKNRYMDPRFQTEHRLQLEKMEDFSSHETAWASMMNSFTQHAYTTIRFAKNVPGFKTLSVHDQSRLLQSSVYPIVLLLLSKVYDPVTKTYNYFNYTKEEEVLTMKLFPMLRVLLQHFQHVGEIVTSLKVTNVEYALLSAILLCPSEVKGLNEPEKIERLQNRLSSALQYYEENTYADGAVRYGSLLVRIAELVQCMLQHNLAIGLLLTAHPELKVPQLYDELIAECIKEK